MEKEFNDYNKVEKTFIAMQKFGGSFVQTLGYLYFYGDPVNKKKLEETFSNYIEEYYEKFVRHYEKK